jgi:ribonuclease HII
LQDADYIVPAIAGDGKALVVAVASIVARFSRPDEARRQYREAVHCYCDVMTHLAFLERVFNCT